MSSQLINGDDNSSEDNKSLQQLADQHLKEGRYREAFEYARRAARLNPERWQPWLTLALSLRMLGQIKAGLGILIKLHKRFPDIPEIRLDFGDYICKVFGDWKFAEHVWQPLKQDKKYASNMAWFHIKQQIYVGSKQGPAALTEEIVKFSQTHLTQLPEQTIAKRAVAPVSIGASLSRGRKRIGLIATFFYATPVYYMCIGSLRHLAIDNDLIFLSRETIDDWATQEFKHIAHSWHSVKGLNSDDLTSFIRKQQFDVLIDMCGWLDRDVLQALACHPSKQMYKWIGGQSTTTGMTAFDGYISDVHQSPLELQTYFSEPLILLDSGYASYTPPKIYAISPGYNS